MKRTVIEENLLDLLLCGAAQDLQNMIDTIHPAGIPDLLHKHKEHAQSVLSRLSDDISADIVEEKDGEDKYELLKRFSDSKQRYILDKMSSDEVADLVGGLEGDEQANILGKADSEGQEDVRKLMSLDAESAGGIMTTGFIRIYTKNIVKDTLQFLQKSTDEETTCCLYVVDREDVLKRVVSLCDIVTSSSDTPIMDIMNPSIKTVLYSDDQGEVAYRFEKYGFIPMPVVDEQQHMLEVIEFGDIIDIIQEENTEDIRHLGGVSKKEWVDSSVRESFSSCIPWLIVNPFAAVLAVAVVNMFKAAIAQAVAFATIMPTATGVGGNAGTQTLTIVARSSSLGELTKENAVVALLKEIGVGILNGIVIGVIVAFGIMLMGNSPIFGLVTGAIMFLNMILINLAGYFIPVILKKLHADPALASDVFITTVTNVMRFFMFLGLATLAPPYIIWRVMYNMSR